MRIALGILTLFAALAPIEAGRSDRQISRALADWIEGPVRYIAEPHEEQSFERLPDDAARALFIENFWARRDPDPRTLGNAYRRLFWERVSEANARFLDAAKPGWMTDRGKIHILYGPPSKIEEDLHRRIGDGVGWVRWLYQGRPGGRSDGDPMVIVPFERDQGGEYKLSHNPRLASVFFNRLQSDDPEIERWERFREMAGLPRASELSVMLDLGRMQEVPPEAQVLLERVETFEAYDTEALPLRVQQLRHPERDGVMVALTADLAGTTPGTPSSIVARFRPEGAAEATRILGEDSFRYVERDGLRLAQGRIVLDPGSYELTMMVVDPARGLAAMHRAPLTVDPPPSTIAISEITLAASLSSLDYGSLASYDEPYIFGPYEVVPRVSERIVAGEPVGIFYEVYGASFPLEVAYRLEGQEADGRWVGLGRPSTLTQPGTAQAWELATDAGWPTGRYRLRVEVVDADGKLASRSVEFELVLEARASR